VHRYLRPLLEKVEAGEIDPAFIVSHRLHHEQAPEGYNLNRDKQDGCVKVVLTP
jgi:threonine dehydrogenase-like Zn-dependent dehydrogenase